jgi:hypothetical protein
MPSDQITGIIRAILAALGGFVLAKGWFSVDTWNWIVGGAVVIGPAIWSWITNRPSSMAATVQNLPGVNVTTSAGAPAAVVASVAAAKANP